MSIPVTIQPGTLSTTCYPNSPQDLYVEMVQKLVAFLSTTFAGIYADSSEPPADQRDKAWFHTGVQKLYWYYNGNWVRKYEVPANSQMEGIWSDTPDNLALYMGGNAGAVGDMTGPFWEVDHDFDGRTLLGPGQLPDNASITIALDDAGGESRHSLTSDEMPPHTHKFTVIAQNSSGGGSGALTGGENNNPNDGQYSGTTESTGGTGSPVAVSPHNTLPPYRSRYVVKRTARVYCIAPN